MAGLGNPGDRYAGTRHNIGFQVVERLAQDWRASPWRIEGESRVAQAHAGAMTVLLIEPLTYMNRSGRAVAPWLDRFGLDADALVVVHDDMDLPFGRVKIRVGGGHGGHNGVRSLADEIGNGDFIRVKMGVGRPPEGVDAAAHVLAPFAESESMALDVFVSTGADAVRAILGDGALAAMNRFHATRET